jgi:hypothetical protein
LEPVGDLAELVGYRLVETRSSSSSSSSSSMSPFERRG